MSTTVQKIGKSIIGQDFQIICKDCKTHLQYDAGAGPFDMTIINEDGTFQWDLSDWYCECPEAELEFTTPNWDVEVLS